LGLLLALAAPASSFAPIGGGAKLYIHPPPAAVSLPRRRLPAAPTTMMAKKFDKKYDDAFDDFRTSGSMPNIPSIGEQYSNAASFVRSTGVEVEGDQQAFGKRLTEAQKDLQRQQDESLAEYEEIKKELVADTAFVGSLGFSCATAFLPQMGALSYMLGMFGSIGYSVLLTKSADGMGSLGMDTSQLQRFGLLFALILICAKNPDTVQILPVLFGFFVPYKVASLRSAFVSLPPLRPDEVRVFRYAGDSPETPPFKVQFGSEVSGRPRIKYGIEGNDVKDMYVTGANTPLGSRKIPSLDEQYQRLKDGTMD